MARQYLKQSVYDAAVERIKFTFNEFDSVLVSCSGGKDSLVMLQITNNVAIELSKQYDVIFLDQECISNYTVIAINKIKSLSNIRRFWHICLPFEEDNAVSVFNPQWIMWDDLVEELWIRPIPSDSINISNQPFPFFRKGMADLEFYPLFSAWLAGAGTIGNLIGLRSSESLNRWRAVTRESVHRYKQKKFTVIQDKKVVKVYPMYDWLVADIWKCTFDNDFVYNELYELMTAAGICFSAQRICQPFGIEQRQGLDLFAKTEPELWNKLVNRVSGANYGAIYARSEMFGHIKSSKPNHMTWEQYAIFLLESIGMEHPEIEDQYREKIITTLKYHKKQYDQLPTDTIVLKGKEYISWREIAKALEKNDYWMKSLLFSETKKGYERLAQIKAKYFDLL